MSTFVEFTIDIEGYRPERKDLILSAVRDNFLSDFDNVDEGKDDNGNPCIEIHASCNFSGDSDDFGKQVIKSVWDGNLVYCHVEVTMRFPEFAPVDGIEGDEELYKELCGIIPNPPEQKSA